MQGVGVAPMQPLTTGICCPTQILNHIEKMGTKAEIDALPTLTCLGISVHVHAELLRDFIIRQSNLPQPIHLPRQESRLTAADREKFSSERIALAFPRHNVLFGAPSRMTLRPCSMVKKPIDL